MGRFALVILAACALFCGYMAYLEDAAKHAVHIPRASVGNPHVVMLTLDDSLTRYEPMWEIEVGRRFTNAVGVLVHGTGDVEGVWCAKSAKYGSVFVPITRIVADVQAPYPTRTVVLLACNPKHQRLGIPGVYYSTGSVWCMPDRSLKDTNLNRFATLDFIPFEFFPPLDLPSTRPVEPTRWERDPSVVGNVYELVTE